MNINFFIKIHKQLRKNNLLVQIILPWIIIFFAIFLRLYKVDYFPIHNESDSIVHVWTGISLFKNIKKPISNSIFVKEYNQIMFWRSDYKYYDTVRRFGFHLIDPYLDHPPLAMIFISLPAKIFGFTDFTQVPQILVNLPAVFMSVFSLLLTFLLAKRLFDFKTACLGLMVYGFSPIFVFSHRQPYLENFITPVFLLVLIILNKYLKVEKKLYLFVLILLNAISSWIKLPAFWITIISCFWFIKAKKYRQTLIIFFTGAFSLFSYFCYGLWVDKNHFLYSFSIQSGRGMDINAFVRILTSPDFYQPFLDGFYLLGFIAIFALFIYRKKVHQKNKKIDFFLLNFILWLILILITTNKTNNFFWYRYPIYPFLSIAIGVFLNRLLKTNGIFLFFPLYLLGFFGIDVLEISLPTTILRFSYLSILGLFFFNYLFPQKKINQLFSYYLIRAILIFILVLNILTVIKYPTFQCQNAKCLMPDKIIVKN